MPDEQIHDLLNSGPNIKERRLVERRVNDQSVPQERRSGMDRRRGPGRRRTDQRRSAEEGEMTPEQFEFLMAVNEYKRVNERPFPSWTEILDIIEALGYRKVAPASPIR